MFKIEFQEAGHVLTMRMEGRFVAQHAEQTRDLFTRCKPSMSLVVDLSDVSFVDAQGEEVLLWLGKLGSQFWADSAFSLDLCERLHLPLATKCAGDAHEAV